MGRGPSALTQRGDFELLQAWRAGDDASGTALVRRHFDAVYGFFVNKTGDRPEELTQKTFLRALELVERFRREASFRAFLIGVARYILLEYLRAAGREFHTFNPEVVSVADVLETPSQVAARHEEERILLAALRSIPIDFQVTLELFYWEGLDSGEIAEALEIPRGTVKSRLHRAREHLRDRLEAMDIQEALRRSTITNLDSWARRIRGAIARPASEGDDGNL